MRCLSQSKQSQLSRLKGDEGFKKSLWLHGLAQQWWYRT